MQYTYEWSNSRHISFVVLYLPCLFNKLLNGSHRFTNISLVLNCLLQRPSRPKD